MEKTATVDVPGVELSMETLGALADGAAAATALRPLVNGVPTLDRDAAEGKCDAPGRPPRDGDGASALRGDRGRPDRTGHRRARRRRRRARRVPRREPGHRTALRKRLEIETPRWRAFQLAFILLNLPGLADPRDLHRETVDLLFFPTGGGKTEAYLGLAGFAMVLRRLRHPDENGLTGAGVTVIMRYTLRLLTLDQLARAAGLVCALELEREREVARYGDWPFEIGLWVGKVATPNILGKKPILFEDDDKAAGQQMRSSVVAPAQRSARADQKAKTKQTEQGEPVHSFETLLKDLATIVKNRIRPVTTEAVSFEAVTTPTALQKRALDLLGIRP